MFKRLMRVLKSWMGFFISFAEDPEVMLQESIEEMRNTLPRLNQILVTTRATVIRLEEERDALAKKEKSLVASIQAALKEGSTEARKIAESDAMTLQQVRQEMGPEAVHLLLDAVERADRPPRRVVLATELVVRASSAGRSQD